MSAVDPISVVEAWQRRAWCEGDATAVDELAADVVLRHGPSGTQRRTHADLKQDLVGYQRSLGKPDLVVHDRVVDGDRVWSRITMRGAHADTGEARSVDWLQIHRVVDGRIAEIWALYSTESKW